MIKAEFFNPLILNKNEKKSGSLLSKSLASKGFCHNKTQTPVNELIKQ